MGVTFSANEGFEFRFIGTFNDPQMTTFFGTGKVLRIIFGGGNSYGLRVQLTYEFPITLTATADATLILLQRFAFITETNSFNYLMGGIIEIIPIVVMFNGIPTGTNFRIIPFAVQNTTIPSIDIYDLSLKSVDQNIRALNNAIAKLNL